MYKFKPAYHEVPRKIKILKLNPFTNIGLKKGKAQRNSSLIPNSLSLYVKNSKKPFKASLSGKIAD